MKTSIQHILGENVRRGREGTGLGKLQFCLTAGISRPELVILRTVTATPSWKRL